MTQNVRIVINAELDLELVTLNDKLTTVVARQTDFFSSFVVPHLSIDLKIQRL